VNGQAVCRLGGGKSLGTGLERRENLVDLLSVPSDLGTFIGDQLGGAAVEPDVLL
jgi:hypothetical protein